MLLLSQKKEEEETSSCETEMIHFFRISPTILTGIEQTLLCRNLFVESVLSFIMKKKQKAK